MGYYISTSFTTSFYKFTSLPKNFFFLQSYMSLYLKIPHHQILIANSYLILLNYFNLVSKNWKTLISVWHFLLNKYLLFHFLYSILYSTHFCILLYVLLFIVYLVSHFFVIVAMLITLDNDIQAAKAHCWLLFSSLVVDLPSS